MQDKAESFLKKITLEELPQVVLAYGEEEYYKELILERLVQQLFAEVPSSERSIVSFSEQVDLAQLSEAINTYPFFSGRSLVILRDLKLWAGTEESTGKKKQEQAEELLSLLQDVPAYTYVLCLAGKVDKRKRFFTTINKVGAVVECSSLRSYSLKPWLEEQAALYGAKFEYQACALVMEYMSVLESVPLLLLKQELGKLALYAGKRKLWTVQDVETIFADVPEVSRFAVANAISKGKPQEFLELLQLERAKGTNIIAVLAVVSAEVRRLCQVKELVTQGAGQSELVAQLHMHPYAADLMLKGVRQFSLQALHTTLADLTVLNMELRQGGRGFERLEEIVVGLLATQKKSY